MPWLHVGRLQVSVRPLNSGEFEFDNSDSTGPPRGAGADEDGLPNAPPTKSSLAN